jgi:hypothetical protein
MDIRNAIYLNNAAVTFMARGELERAKEIFPVALHAMNHVVLEHQQRQQQQQQQRQVQPEDLCSLLPHSDVQGMVEKATRQLACPEQSKDMGNGSHPHHNLLPQMSTVPLSLETNLEVVPFFECAFSSQRFSYLPMRIADVDSIDAKSRIEEICPAIMLMNYALLYACLSEQRGDSEDCDLHIQALRLLDMGLKVLRVNGTPTAEASENHIFVAIALMHNVCYLSRNDHVCCPEFLAIMEEQLDMLKHVARNSFFRHPIYVVAAGAA